MGRSSLKRIAVIPARGGSKRIPHKNIIDFEGKPLLVWTIQAAQESGLFDRIVVSTDDREIAEVAERAGVQVPFLRIEANDDVSPISLATVAAVTQAQTHWGEEYKTVTQLMPTCPLRTSEVIAACHNQFAIAEVNSQISCFKFEWMNAWWAAKLDSRFVPEFLFPDAVKGGNVRSQELPSLYAPCGAVWIGKTCELLRTKTFYSEGHTLFPIPWKAAVDIDSYEDLEFAKAIFRIK